LAKSFRELNVWKKSIDLTVLIYRLTAGFPKAETYGLTSQMRRATVSIASNIAEGSARGTSKDFKQFVRIARGSTCELLTQLVITSRLALVDPAKIQEAEELANEVGRMLSGLQDFLSKPKVPQHQHLTTKN
jgi:four helix bundle protein